MSGCSWANVNQRNQKYHDEEWGIPVHEDRQMFEHLMLECLQCGLSWDLILKKRKIFRECMDYFDYEKIACYTEEDVERLLHTEGMIRSRRKICAIIHNAQCFRRIREEFGTFCQYLWGYTDGKVLCYTGHERGQIPVSNTLSTRISQDLKKRGFRYVGPITIYSHLQACGIINDHDESCPIYQKILASYETMHLLPDGEKSISRSV